MPSPALLPEKVKAAWEFIEDLRGGGQSSTFRIRNKVDGRDGVLKICDAVGGGVSSERFKREIAVLESIHHPAVIRLIDKDEHSKPPWYISPLGQPLDRFWSKHASELEPGAIFLEAAKLIRPILEGLAVFHGKAGVHRDIKPDNVVMLEAAGTLRPVLIDFGLAIRPGDARLTALDERAVANRFAAPPEAYYGEIEDPPQSWDCLGVAWLWAWLLSEGKAPKSQRFHWKYHRFVGDPRCERVRALLAACSQGDMGPKNAGELLRLAETLGLWSQLLPAEQHEASERFKKAESAHADALAASLKARASKEELAEVGAKLLGPLYEGIRGSLGEIVRAAQAARLPVKENVYNTTGILSVEGPVAERIRAAALHPSGIEPCIHSIKAGNRERKYFLIYVTVRFREPAQDADFLPFTLVLSLRHDMGEFEGSDISYWHKRDGTMWLEATAEQVNAKHLVDLAREWLASEDHWKCT